MTRFGIDCSWDRPTTAALKRDKVTFIGRYLTLNPWPKSLTKDEVVRYQSAGLDIYTIFQETKGGALGGWRAGVQHAKAAVEHLRRVGGPKEAAVFFAVDFDARGTQIKTCLDYYKGTASEIGAVRNGCYGGIRVVDAALDSGLCTLAMQTSSWSEGRWDPRVHIQQYEHDVRVADINADKNRAMKDYFGQWIKEGDVGYLDWSAEDRRAFLKDVLGVVRKGSDYATQTYGDEKGVVGGKETHPVNLEAIQADLKAHRVATEPPDRLASGSPESS